jgi:5'-3' exonuclease
MKSHEVNVMEFLFRKILIGDAGDNVPPLHTLVKETKRGPVTYRVTDKHANEILNQFKDDKPFVNQSHFFTDEHIERICTIAKAVIKIDKSVEEICERWKTNRDLVYLHVKCIPSDVCESMFSSIEVNTKSLSGNAVHSVMDKDRILAGTTYTKAKKTEFNESGLFKPISESTSDVKIVEKKESSFDDGFWNDLLK